MTVAPPLFSQPHRDISEPNGEWIFASLTLILLLPPSTWRCFSSKSQKLHCSIHLWTSYGGQPWKTVCSFLYNLHCSYDCRWTVALKYELKNTLLIPPSKPFLPGLGSIELNLVVWIPNYAIFDFTAVFLERRLQDWITLKLRQRQGRSLEHNWSRFTKYIHLHKENITNITLCTHLS